MTRAYGQWVTDREMALADLQARFPDADVRGIWLDMVASAFDPDSGAVADDGGLFVEGLVEVTADLHNLYVEENYGIPDALARLAELIDERLARLVQR